MQQHTAGSPFVVGRPLRSDEPIFGRDEAFAFIASGLAKFSSINIVGERRMGKTSLLNHLLTHQNRYLAARTGQPPLVLARIDLQGNVTNAARFYGTALRELLAHLPVSSPHSTALKERQEQLVRQPEVDYDQFDRALRLLCDPNGLCLRPVIVIDEFERLLEPAAADGFPYPTFFNNLSALITANLLALVVASRRPLAEYFTDPRRPGSLTSALPRYLMPFTLRPLSRDAADDLLLQTSDRPLTLGDATKAWEWTQGHPCHLQAAGQAWYEAKTQGETPAWANGRFQEYKRQNCMVHSAATPEQRSAAKPLQRGCSMLTVVLLLLGLLLVLLYFVTGKIPWTMSGSQIMWALATDVPQSVGRRVQQLGSKIDDIAAWIIGCALIIMLLLLALRVVTGNDVLTMLKKWLGLGS